ncbi:hypothetical protein PG985_002257 [Apiospora marii]|uniref:uncharacterized protein n=1 Tax=Apiospora marii TaxID=335849 RepID=UPI00312E47BE
MSARIVYEGAVAGEGGTLFQGKRFWLAQRTPTRKTWIDHIKVYPRQHLLFLARPTLTFPQNNGGQVVLLEKNADYLIADHLWKDTPQGSYTWKWIQESVKKGKLLDPDDYLIGSKPQEQARVRPSAPGKSTRTPYTDEDDRVLMEWVTKRQREGESVLGNKIYQELEVKNPRHTFHSWRDRWLKKVSLKPRPDISSEKKTGSSTSRRPSTNGYLVKQEKKPRTKFTAEEDAQLTAYVLEKTAKTGYDRGNKVFQEHANEFPQHSWHAYRDRWIKYLRQAYVDEEEVEPLAEEEIPQARTTKSNGNDAQSSKDERPETARQTTKENSNAVKEKPEPSRGGTPSVTQRQEVSASASPGHVRRSPRNAKKMETQVEIDHQLNDDNDLNDEDAHSQARDIRAEAAGISDKPAQTRVDHIENSLQSKEQFYPIYHDFVQSFDHIRPNLWPTVRGRSFDLWDLWQNVVSQKVDTAERDWQQIAENLGYDWVDQDGVEDDLREIYEEYLAEFEESLVGFEDCESDDSEEDEDVPQEVAAMTGVSGALDSDSEERFDSSPPKQPSLKRAHDAAMLSDQPYPDSSGKRQRISKDSEIPSTPDTTNGTSHLRRPVSAAVSPTDRQMSALPKSSSSRARQSVQNGLGRPGKGRVAEPETQDFQYDPETQNIVFDVEMEDIQEESQDITASQQLHFESEPGSSPVKSASHPPARPSTPPPKRKAGKTPFVVDSPDEDEDDQPTPKARFGKGKNPLLADLEKQQQQQRLRRVSAGSPPPKSSIAPQPKPQRPSATRPETSRPPPPSFPSSSVTSSSKPARPPPSSARNPEASRPPAAAASRKPSSSAVAKDPVASRIAEFNATIDEWVAYGYAPPAARRALEATSWQRDLVVEIIGPLQEGKPLPTNYEGVWTAKDDVKLQSLEEYQAAKKKPGFVADEKLARKMEKFDQHLTNKHGKGHIDLRKKWYEDKKYLGWGETV